MPLDSTATNKSPGELQALLNENPWKYNVHEEWCVSCYFRGCGVETTLIIFRFSFVSGSNASG